MVRPSVKVACILFALGWMPGLWPAACGQGFTPEEAAARMTVPEGFRAELVAAEPLVRQPIFVKFDRRGRLWTIQYLQYPNPAGLTRMSVDRWSRTVYDRVPEPPPEGPRGADRITILEDLDGDRRADAAHDFVVGLNLCTGLAFAEDGVYVLQTPYLLFYPDRNRDDVPDADPRVVLDGFGMEDAQALSNHLTWGPDGWLYGLNGSTTTCRIRGWEFQQAVWRYNPMTDEFEVFCEGGGNGFGLTFDAVGNLYYSSNGGLCYHGLQGAYYEKSFGKHGPLHNPFAYGYFSHVEHEGLTARPNTGGTIYLGETFPIEFQGAFICGDFLGHTCSYWKVAPQGATVRMSLGGYLLESHDTWFGPTDLCLGPDGAIYVSDFCDPRTAHPDPDANWDTSNGRIYRVGFELSAVDTALPPLDELSSGELVNLLYGANGWLRQEARQLLAARQDSEVAERLRAGALQAELPQFALESLWVLNLCGWLDDGTACELLEHSAPAVRTWTVRLLGDTRRASPAVEEALQALAAVENDLAVLSQIAASAQRLPGPLGVALAQTVLGKDVSAGDPHLPLQCWWAIERHAIAQHDALCAWLAEAETWNLPLAPFIGGRLARRYAADATATGYDACATLLRTAPAEQRTLLRSAVAQGLAERAAPLSDITQGGLYERFAAVVNDVGAADGSPLPPVGGALQTELQAWWDEDPADPERLRVALLADLSGADETLLATLENAAAPSERLQASLALAAEFAADAAADAILTLAQADHPQDVRLAAISAAARFSREDVPARLLSMYADADDAVRESIRATLFARPEGARAFLEEVEAGAIDPQSVPEDDLRRIALHRDAKLDALVRRHWGRIGPGTPDELLATIRRLHNDLRAGAGDPVAGRELFRKHCGVCHELFGEGGRVGPELTKANRGDLEALLVNVVSPSTVIRREYQSYLVVTDGGQVHTGVLAEQDGASLTLLDAKNNRVRLLRTEIESLEESPLSLMPEKLLDPLTPQMLRDLFAYLQRTSPLE